MRDPVLSYQPPTLLAAGEMSVSALERVAGQITTSPPVNQWGPTSSSPNLLIQCFRRRETFFLDDVCNDGISLLSLGSYCLCDGGGGGHVIDRSTICGRGSPQKEYVLHRPKKGTSVNHNFQNLIEPENEKAHTQMMITRLKILWPGTT